MEMTADYILYKGEKLKGTIEYLGSFSQLMEDEKEILKKYEQIMRDKMNFVTLFNYSETEALEMAKKFV